MKWDIPIGEEIHPGNLGCQGCGGALAMRLALKALGPDTVIAMATGCMETRTQMVSWFAS